MKYSLRFYQEGDEDKIVTLLNSVFDTWPKIDLQNSKLDYWRWKNEPGKELDNTIVLGVNERDEVIGFFSKPLFFTKIGEEEHLVQQGFDLAVHPDYRRMGLSNELRRFLPMNYLRYGSTVNPIVKNTRLNRGVEFKSPIFVYLKIENYSIYKKKREQHPLWLIRHQLLERYDSVISKKKVTTYDAILVDKFDERINDFWDYVKKDYVFSLRKDMEYLNWRYNDPRGGDYKVFVVEDGSILGYGVARINRIYPDKLVGSIVELIVKDDDRTVFDSLFLEIDDFFTKEEVNERNIWVLKNSKLARLIKGHGYVNTYWDIFVHFNSNDGSKLELMDFIRNASPDRVNFQMGDTDAI